MKKTVIISVLVASSLGLAACGKKAEEAASGAAGAATNTMSDLGSATMGAAGNVVSGAGNVVSGVGSTVGDMGGAMKDAGASAVDKAATAVGDKAKEMGVPGAAADGAVQAGAEAVKEKM
jgi:hypothetical protein